MGPPTSRPALREGRPELRAASRRCRVGHRLVRSQRGQRQRLARYGRLLAVGIRERFTGEDRPPHELGRHEHLARRRFAGRVRRPRDELEASTRSVPDSWRTGACACVRAEIPVRRAARSTPTLLCRPRSCRAKLVMVPCTRDQAFRLRPRRRGVVTARSRYAGESGSTRVSMRSVARLGCRPCRSTAGSATSGCILDDHR